MENSCTLVIGKNASIYSEKPKITLLVVFFALTNIFTYNINSLSLCIAVIQTIIVLYYLLIGNIEDMILSFVIFASTSIESSFFVTSRTDVTIYSFLGLPYVHYYHLFIILLIGFVWAHRKNNTIVFKQKKDGLLLYVLLIYIFEFIITGITLLLDDNRIHLISDRYIIKDMYNTYYVIMVIAVLISCLKNNQQFVYKLENTVAGILTGLTLSGTIAVFFGKINTTSVANPILICPLAFFYAPVLILLFFKKGRSLRYLLFGLLSIIIQIKYSVGIPGAWLLLVMVCIFVFAVNTVKGAINNNNLRLLLFVILCIIPVIVILVINGVVITNNDYINYKLSTVKNLFNFRNGIESWISNTGDSISIRIETLINIIVEFIKKPWFIITGKGFGGSIRKYFGHGMWDNFGSAFPDEMIINGIFSQFHVQLFELLIDFGLIGVVLIFNIISKMFKRHSDIRFNGWKYVGLFWLLILPWEFRSMIIGSCFVALALYDKKDLYRNVFDE